MQLGRQGDSAPPAHLVLMTHTVLASSFSRKHLSGRKEDGGVYCPRPTPKLYDDVLDRGVRLDNWSLIEIWQGHNMRYIYYESSAMVLFFLWRCQNFTFFIKIDNKKKRKHGYQLIPYCYHIQNSFFPPNKFGYNNWAHCTSSSHPHPSHPPRERDWETLPPSPTVYQILPSKIIIRFQVLQRTFHKILSSC